MQKILFNDAFHLTEKVLNGDKTMTRRVARLMIEEKQHLDDTADFESVAKILINLRSHYHVGEDVAVAMSYEHAYQLIQKRIAEINPDVVTTAALDYKVWAEKLPGWSNKMFVLSQFMPYLITIDEVRLERLQWISPGDCIQEGVRINDAGKETFYTIGNGQVFDDPRAVFAGLVNRCMNKDVFSENPWVFVYHFSVHSSPFLEHQLSNVKPHEQE